MGGGVWLLSGAEIAALIQKKRQPYTDTPFYPCSLPPSSPSFFFFSPFPFNPPETLSSLVSDKWDVAAPLTLC